MKQKEGEEKDRRIGRRKTNILNWEGNKTRERKEEEKNRNEKIRDRKLGEEGEEKKQKNSERKRR